MTFLALVAVGLVAGSLASALGIGGGIVYVPALVTLFAFDQHTAQGTSLAVIVPAAVIGAWAHHRAGRVDWRLAIGLGLGGVTGGLIGAQVALALDAQLLRRLFAGFLILMAVRMLLKTERKARVAAQTE